MATTKKGAVKKSSLSKPNRNNINLQQALQEHFGFEKFKGQQEEIIQSVLSGNYGHI